MNPQTATALALALLLVASPVHATGEDDETDVKTSASQSFFVIVDEYELSQVLEPDASGKRILEIITEGHADLSHVRRCAVTATLGVPTRATFSQHVATADSPIIVGAGMNILLKHHGPDVKVQLRYESSGLENAGGSRGPVVSSEIESTLLMSPGDVRLCGLLKQGSTKIFTVRLSH